MLLQRTKWAIFVSVPIWFGYGFARNPDNLEWVKEVVSWSSSLAFTTAARQQLAGMLTWQQL